MYESTQIGHDVYGLVTFHSSHWGHACLKGLSSCALVASPFSFATAASCICVFHRYSVFYDVVHDLLIVNVLSPNDCDFLDLPTTSFEPSPLNTQRAWKSWQKPVLRVIERSPMSLTAVYEEEEKTERRFPARYPKVTLNCASFPTPLAVCSPFISVLLFD